jgi:hypothetical protein
VRQSRCCRKVHAARSFCFRRDTNAQDQRRGELLCTDSPCPLYRAPRSSTSSCAGDNGRSIGSMLHHSIVRCSMPRTERDGRCMCDKARSRWESGQPWCSVRPRILLSIPAQGRGRDGTVDSSTALSVLVLDPSFLPVEPMGVGLGCSLFQFQTCFRTLCYTLYRSPHIGFVVF